MTAPSSARLPECRASSATLLPGATPATHLSTTLAARTAADYTYDPATATYKRVSNGTPQVVEGGGQVAATNVILWFVPYTISPGDVDPVGEPVTEAQVTGAGDAAA